MQQPLGYLLSFSIASTKLVIVFLLTLTIECFGQLNYDFTEGKFLIKGQVIDVQTKKPIANANIRLNGTNKGISCDNEGYFAFYVQRNDTLKFSSTGYLPKIIHMSDINSAKYYTLEIQLMHDFVKLKEVTIYPYRDIDDFKKAFVDAKEVNKVTIVGIAAPKYSNKIPKAKFTNPVSFLYERLKRSKSS